ncbi:MAG: FapA family protein [Oscillospiraceae bacterium]|nr:FapA family protein [Oscillospiraceae bacterium]
MRQNAYFKLNTTNDGLYLTVYPQSDGGDPVSFLEINLYLAKTKIERIDKEALKNALAHISGQTEIKLSDIIIPPVDESISVKMSEDKMKAFVRVYPESNDGKKLGKNEFIEKLSVAGVKHGIIDEAVDNWLQNRSYCTDFPVAEGTPPEQSRDAVIEYHFDTDNDFRPETDDDGNIDFHQLNLLNQVSAGDVLAVLTPAYDGQPGINVPGVKIPSAKPLRLRLKYGNNTEISEDECVLTAKVSGHVEMQSGKITVNNVYTVKGDVGPGTGDVDYDGTVLVKGDVLAGYSVKATGDIYVSGIMEAAFLTAGGKIILAKGVHGEAKGRLNAGGDIVSKFIQMCTVVSGGNISANSILHSKVFAKSSILADFNPGYVSGGELKATALISVKVVGSATSGAHTLLETGPDRTLMDEYHELEKLLVEKRTEQRRLRQIAGEAAEADRGHAKQSAPPGISTRLERTNAEVEELMKSYIRLKAEIETDSSGKIVVKNTIHEGTKIIMSNVSYYVHDAVSACQFTKEGAEVKCYSL